MPHSYPHLVLTQNEVGVDDRYAWNDIEGFRYHYPNQYRNRIWPGRMFVYYRGVNRADGRREPADYFGCGRIGEISPDPAQPAGIAARDQHWYCSIEDYVRFDAPVPAKQEERFAEQLGRGDALQRNHFRTAVRELSSEAYQYVLTEARLAPAAPVLAFRGRAPVPVEEARLAEADLASVLRPSPGAERAGSGKRGGRAELAGAEGGRRPR